MALKKFNQWIAAILVALQIATVLPNDARSAVPARINSAILPRAIHVSDWKIPENLGHVVLRQRGSGSKTLIFIEDAHAASEAQTSIVGLVDLLKSREQLTDVFLEGLHTAPDLTLYQTFPDRQWLKKQLDEALQSSELSGGAVHAILDSDEIRPLPLENQEEYEAAIRTYREALIRRDDLLDKTSSRLRDLRSRAVQMFSKEASELESFLDVLYGDFDAVAFTRGINLLQQRSSGEWLIDSSLKDLKRIISPAAFHKRPVVQKALLQILQRNAETAGAWLQGLQTNNVSVIEIAKQWKHGVAVEGKKLHRVSQSDIALLNRLAADADALSELRSGVWHDKLKNMAFAQMDALLDHPQARDLHRKMNRMRLLKRLVKMELSRDEWNDVSKLKLHAFWEPFLAFYRSQSAREKTYELRISAVLRARDTAAVIAGGFHREAFLNMCKKRGWSGVVVHPYFENIPESDRYVRLMLGEVRWNKYFQNRHGQVDLQSAFLSFLADRLKEEYPAEAYRMISEWRNEVIRKLARNGRAAEFSNYENFFAKKLAGSISTAERERLKLVFQNQIQDFASRVQNLKSANRFSPAAVAALLPNQANVIPAAQIPLQVIAADLVLQTSKKEMRNKSKLPILARSESRNFLTPELIHKYLSEPVDSFKDGLRSLLKEFPEVDLKFKVLDRDEIWRGVRWVFSGSLFQSGDSQRLNSFRERFEHYAIELARKLKSDGFSDYEFMCKRDVKTPYFQMARKPVVGDFELWLSGQTRDELGGDRFKSLFEAVSLFQFVAKKDSGEDLNFKLRMGELDALLVDAENYRAQRDGKMPLDQHDGVRSKDDAHKLMRTKIVAIFELLDQELNEHWLYYQQNHRLIANHFTELAHSQRSPYQTADSKLEFANALAKILEQHSFRSEARARSKGLAALLSKIIFWRTRLLKANAGAVALGVMMGSAWTLFIAADHPLNARPLEFFYTSFASLIAGVLIHATRVMDFVLDTGLWLGQILRRLMDPWWIRIGTQTELSRHGMYEGNADKSLKPVSFLLGVGIVAAGFAKSWLVTMGLHPIVTTFLVVSASWLAMNIIFNFLRYSWNLIRGIDPLPGLDRIDGWRVIRQNSGGAAGNQDIVPPNRSEIRTDNWSVEEEINKETLLDSAYRKLNWNAPDYKLLVEALNKAEQKRFDELVLAGLNHYVGEFVEHTGRKFEGQAAWKHSREEDLYEELRWNRFVGDEDSEQFNQMVRALAISPEHGVSSGRLVPVRDPQLIQHIAGLIKLTLREILPKYLDGKYKTKNVFGYQLLSRKWFGYRSWLVFFKLDKFAMVVLFDGFFRYILQALALVGIYYAVEYVGGAELREYVNRSARLVVFDRSVDLLQAGIAGLILSSFIYLRISLTRNYFERKLRDTHRELFYRSAFRMTHAGEVRNRKTYEKNFAEMIRRGDMYFFSSPSDEKRWNQAIRFLKSYLFNIGSGHQRFVYISEIGREASKHMHQAGPEVVLLSMIAQIYNDNPAYLNELKKQAQRKKLKLLLAAIAEYEQFYKGSDWVRREAESLVDQASEKYITNADYQAAVERKIAELVVREQAVSWASFAENFVGGWFKIPDSTNRLQAVTVFVSRMKVYLDWLKRKTEAHASYHENFRVARLARRVAILLNLLKRTDFSGNKEIEELVHQARFDFNPKLEWLHQNYSVIFAPVSARSEMRGFTPMKSLLAAGWVAAYYLLSLHVLLPILKPMLAAFFAFSPFTSIYISLAVVGLLRMFWSHMLLNRINSEYDTRLFIKTCIIYLAFGLPITNLVSTGILLDALPVIQGIPQSVTVTLFAQLLFFPFIFNPMAFVFYVHFQNGMDWEITKEKIRQNLTGYLSFSSFFWLASYLLVWAITDPNDLVTRIARLNVAGLIFSVVTQLFIDQEKPQPPREGNFLSKIYQKKAYWVFLAAVTVLVYGMFFNFIFEKDDDLGWWSSAGMVGVIAVSYGLLRRMKKTDKIRPDLQNRSEMREYDFMRDSHFYNLFGELRFLKEFIQHDVSSSGSATPSNLLSHYFPSTDFEVSRERDMRVDFHDRSSGYLYDSPWHPRIAALGQRVLEFMKIMPRINSYGHDGAAAFSQMSPEDRETLRNQLSLFERALKFYTFSWHFYFRSFSEHEDQKAMRSRKYAVLTLGQLIAMQKEIETLLIRNQIKPGHYFKRWQGLRQSKALKPFMDYFDKNPLSPEDYPVPSKEMPLTFFNSVRNVDAWTPEFDKMTPESDFVAAVLKANKTADITNHDRAVELVRLLNTTDVNRNAIQAAAKKQPAKKTSRGRDLAGDHFDRVVAFQARFKNQAPTNMALLQIPARIQGGLELLEMDFQSGNMSHATGYSWAEKAADEGVVELDGLWNPAAGEHEKLNPISVHLDGNKRFLAVTGTNEAGKSTTLEAVLLAILYNQLGLPVPAAKARLSRFNNIFTLVPDFQKSEGDSQHLGFIRKLQKLTQTAKPGDLILIDEAHMGAEYRDLVALTTVLMEDLAKTGATILYATHLREAVKRLQSNPEVGSHMLARFMSVEGDQHFMREGIADSSAAIDTVTRKKMPRQVIEWMQQYHRELLQGRDLSVEPAQRSATSLASKPSNVVWIHLAQLRSVFARAYSKSDFPEKEYPEFSSLNSTQKRGPLKSLDRWMALEPEELNAWEKESRNFLTEAAMQSWQNGLWELPEGKEYLDQMWQLRRTLLEQGNRRLLMIQKMVSLGLVDFIDNDDLEIERVNRLIAGNEEELARAEPQTMTEYVAYLKNRLPRMNYYSDYGFIKDAITMDSENYGDNYFRDRQLRQILRIIIAAKKRGYFAPVFTDPGTPLEIEDARIPGRPKDVSVGLEASANGMPYVIKGPHGSGKTNAIEALAYNLILAQADFPGPAKVKIPKDAEISIFLGAQDDRSGGQSYFNAVAEKFVSIADSAKPGQIILMDELHGSDYWELSALQAALVRYLASQGATVILNTHMREGLALAVRDIPGVHFLKTDYTKQPDGTVQYHYSISPDPDDTAESLGVETVRGILTPDQFGRALALRSQVELPLGARRSEIRAAIHPRKFAGVQDLQVSEAKEADLLAAMEQQGPMPIVTAPSAQEVTRVFHLFESGARVTQEDLEVIVRQAVYESWKAVIENAGPYMGQTGSWSYHEGELRSNQYPAEDFGGVQFRNPILYLSADFMVGWCTSASLDFHRALYSLSAGKIKSTIHGASLAFGGTLKHVVQVVLFPGLQPLYVDVTGRQIESHAMYRNIDAVPGARSAFNELFQNGYVRLTSENARLIGSVFRKGESRKSGDDYEILTKFQTLKTGYLDEDYTPLHEYGRDYFQTVTPEIADQRNTLDEIYARELDRDFSGEEITGMWPLNSATGVAGVVADLMTVVPTLSNQPRKSIDWSNALIDWRIPGMMVGLLGIAINLLSMIAHGFSILRLFPLAMSVLGFAGMSVSYAMKIKSMQRSEARAGDFTLRGRDAKGIEQKKIDESLDVIRGLNEDVTVTWVIPAYNETERLYPKSEEHPAGEDAFRVKVRQLNKLHETNPKFNWRIVFVDDGSPNLNTFQLLNQIRDELKLDVEQVQIIRLDPKDKKGPKGGAVHFGLRAALEAPELKGIPYVGYTDIDISTNLLLTGALVKPFLSRLTYGASIGVRRGKDAYVEGRNWRAIFTSWLYNLVIRLMLPPLKDIEDTQAGFKLFNAHALVEILPELNDSGFSFDSELLLMFALKARRISQVPIAWFDSAEASQFASQSLKRGIEAIKTVMTHQAKHWEEKKLPWLASQITKKWQASFVEISILFQSRDTNPADDKVLHPNWMSNPLNIVANELNYFMTARSGNPSEGIDIEKIMLNLDTLDERLTLFADPSAAEIRQAWLNSLPKKAPLSDLTAEWNWASFFQRNGLMDYASLKPLLEFRDMLRRDRKKLEPLLIKIDQSLNRSEAREREKFQDLRFSRDPGSVFVPQYAIGQEYLKPDWKKRLLISGLAGLYLLFLDHFILDDFHGETLRRLWGETAYFAAQCFFPSVWMIFAAVLVAWLYKKPFRTHMLYWHDQMQWPNDHDFNLHALPESAREKIISWDEIKSFPVVDEEGEDYFVFHGDVIRDKTLALPLEALWHQPALRLRMEWTGLSGTAQLFGSSLPIHIENNDGDFRVIVLERYLSRDDKPELILQPALLSEGSGWQIDPKENVSEVIYPLGGIYTDPQGLPLAQEGMVITRPAQIPVLYLRMDSRHRLLIHKNGYFQSLRELAARPSPRTMRIMKWFQIDDEIVARQKMVIEFLINLVLAGTLWWSPVFVHKTLRYLDTISPVSMERLIDKSAAPSQSAEPIKKAPKLLRSEDRVHLRDALLRIYFSHASTYNLMARARGLSSEDAYRWFAMTSHSVKAAQSLMGRRSSLVSSKVYRDPEWIQGVGFAFRDWLEEESPQRRSGKNILGRLTDFLEGLFETDELFGYSFFLWAFKGWSYHEISVTAGMPEEFVQEMIREYVHDAADYLSVHGLTGIGAQGVDAFYKMHRQMRRLKVQDSEVDSAPQPQIREARSELRSVIQSADIDQWIEQLESLMDSPKGTSKKELNHLKGIIAAQLKRDDEQRNLQAERKESKASLLDYARYLQTDRRSGKGKLTREEAGWLDSFFTLAIAILASDSPELNHLRRLDALALRFNQRYSNHTWGWSAVLLMETALNQFALGEGFNALARLSGNSTRLPGEYGYRMAAMNLALLGLHIPSNLPNETDYDLYPISSLKKALHALKNSNLEDVDPDLREELLLNVRIGLTLFVYASRKFWGSPRPVVYKLRKWLVENRETIRAAFDVWTLPASATLQIQPGSHVMWLVNDLFDHNHGEPTPPVSLDRIFLNPFNRDWDRYRRFVVGSRDMSEEFIELWRAGKATVADAEKSFRQNMDIFMRNLSALDAREIPVGLKRLFPLLLASIAKDAAPQSWENGSGFSSANFGRERIYEKLIHQLSLTSVAVAVMGAGRRRFIVT